MEVCDGFGALAVVEAEEEPGDGPALEFEGLVKLMFAEHGSRADALETIARARAWAVEMNTADITAGQRFAEGEGRHEERRATTVLMGEPLADFYALVARWADWAAAEVEDWPEDIAGPPHPARIDASRVGACRVVAIRKRELRTRLPLDPLATALILALADLRQTARK